MRRLRGAFSGKRLDNQLTTDPLVEFDTTLESWRVQVDAGTYAEIWGRNRAGRASELAGLIRAGQYGDKDEALKESET